MIFLIAISLSADAAAVSLSNCLLFRDNKKIYIMPIYFAVFQGIMTLIGYFFGNLILPFVHGYSKYIVCIILSIIGIKIIYESIVSKENKCKQLTHKILIALAIATSIDALAVGLSLSLIGTTNIFYSSFVIAIVTFLICFAITCTIKRIIIKHTLIFELFAGIILIIIGIKPFL